MRSVRWLFCLGIAALGASPGLAVAQPAPVGAAASNTALEAARGLARDAMAHYEAGRFAAAVEGFEKADAAYSAPQYRLYLARALVQVGKVASAARAYDRAIEMPVPKGAPASYSAAQKTAAQELAELRKRIPVVRVVVARLPGEGVALSVDGAPVPRGMWERVEVDPGQHTLVIAARDHESLTRTFSVSEGGVETVDVSLKRAAAQPVLVPERPRVDEAPVVVTEGSGPKRGVLIAGGAVAGGAVIAGVVLVALSASRASQAETLRGEVVARQGNCPAASGGNVMGTCGELKSALQSRATLVNAGISSFIGAGTVGAATLVYGLVKARQARTSVRVLPSVGGVWVEGSF